MPPTDAKTESVPSILYVPARARAGFHFGHDQLTDDSSLGGLEDAHDGGPPMAGVGGTTAQAHKYSREYFWRGFIDFPHLGCEQSARRCDDIFIQVGCINNYECGDS